MSFSNHESFSANENLQERQISPDVDIKDITVEDVEAISDTEELKNLLLVTLKRAESLQERLDALDKETSSTKGNLVLQKQEKLSNIRFGLTEVNERMERPYLISAGLANAKSALEILAEKGQMNSIILEGEPGTGKTQWAYSEVGQELQEGKDSMLIHVRVKDTMRSQDLLYTVDNIQRLSDAQTSQVPEIVRNEAAEWKKKILSGEIDPSSDEYYKRFSAKLDAIKELGESSKDLDYSNYIRLGPLGEAIVQSAKGKKVWLLIDEIEKGREELMTGMLDEIENLNFTITETGQTIKGNKENMRIVITTNTEESDKIPSSFRRRSLYHYIDYPTRDEMSEIVKLNYPNLQETLLSYALDTFYSLHNDESMQKKPSTPELLSWIQILQSEFPNGIQGESLDKIPHKEILAKYNDDNKHLEEQERSKENADVIWDLMTSTEKGDYLIRREYLYQDDDFVKRITASTGLDFDSICNAIDYLRDDQVRLYEWGSTEEGSNWLKQHEVNSDDRQEYDNYGNEDEDESQYYEDEDESQYYYSAPENADDEDEDN